MAMTDTDIESTHRVRFNPNDMAHRRRRAGLSQEQVGRLIGRRAGTVTRYESGDITPSATILAKLAKAYGCTPNDFYLIG